jgi:hypothetical protein
LFYAVIVASLALEADAPVFVIALVGVATWVAGVVVIRALPRVSRQVERFGQVEVASWREGLWVALVVAALACAIAAFDGFDLRTHWGTIVLAAIGTGAAAVALLVVGERYSSSIAAITPGTFVKVLLILAVGSIPLSIAVNSPLPVAVVVGWGGALLINMMSLRRRP